MSCGCAPQADPGDPRPTQCGCGERPLGVGVGVVDPGIVRDAARALGWSGVRIGPGPSQTRRRRGAGGVVSSGPWPGRSVQVTPTRRQPRPDAPRGGAGPHTSRPRSGHVATRNYLPPFSGGPIDAHGSRNARPWLMVVAAGEGAPTCWQGEGAGCDLWLVEVYSDGSTGSVERLPFGATAENGPAITPRLDRGGGQVVFMHGDPPSIRKAFTTDPSLSLVGGQVVPASSSPTNPTWLNDDVLYNTDDADVLWRARYEAPATWWQEYLGGPDDAFAAGCTLADPSAEVGGRFVALHSSVSACAATDCACPWIEVGANEYPDKDGESATKRVVPLKVALNRLPLSRPAGVWTARLNYLPFTLPGPLEFPADQVDGALFGAAHLATSPRTRRVIAYRQDNQGRGTGRYGYDLWAGVHLWNARGSALVTDPLPELEMFAHDDFDTNPAAHLLEGTEVKEEVIYRHKFSRWLPGDAGVLTTVAVSQNEAAKGEVIKYSRIMMIDLTSGAPVYHDLTAAIDVYEGGKSPFGVQKGDIVPLSPT